MQLKRGEVYEIFRRIYYRAVSWESIDNYHDFPFVLLLLSVLMWNFSTWLTNVVVLAVQKK